MEDILHIKIFKVIWPLHLLQQRSPVHLLIVNSHMHYMDHGYRY
ncbi:hypothetical protein BLA29_014259 [Euroglyphus maynei]|uniref:Uncharacterized protein n=1 Tax=Euroglyphus maynei TaxID=6958 RepID=A0A1Y3BR05_EURMA|nr:hypothetical protein BLA29_014259 [Euroglyphus maynei]